MLQKLPWQPTAFSFPGISGSFTNKDRKYIGRIKPW
jgi:hypothetical protein